MSEERLSCLGRPRKDLMALMKSAKAADFQIYVYNRKKDMAAWLVEYQRKRSLLLRVIFPIIARDELFDRIITPSAEKSMLQKFASGELGAEEGGRIDPSTVWFQAMLQNDSESAPYQVTFFLSENPEKAGMPLPLAITLEGPRYHSGVFTTPTTVLCVIDFAKRGMAGPVVHSLACRYALPFVCAFCGIIGGERMKRCNGCRRIFYCSKECQKRDWAEEHKVHCGGPTVRLLDPNDSEGIAAAKSRHDERSAAFVRRVREMAAAEEAA